MVCWARVILLVGVWWFLEGIIGRLDGWFRIEWLPLERAKVGFGKERREWRSSCQWVKTIYALARDELEPEVGLRTRSAAAAGSPAGQIWGEGAPLSDCPMLGSPRGLR